MSLLWEKMKEYYREPIRSKKMYDWNFHTTLEEIVLELEEAISKEIISKYWVQYTQYWDQIIKIKVKDDNLMIDKLIACNLDYSKNDERYGYIIPKFSSEEKWQKPRKHKLDKFVISEKKVIVSAIVEKLKEIIEEY